MYTFLSHSNAKHYIDSLESDNHERICSFLPNNTGNTVGLSAILEESVLHLRQDVPQELVVSMFQKMASIPLKCLLIYSFS